MPDKFTFLMPEFSPKYLEHFVRPRKVGEVDKPDAEGTVKHEGGGCLDTVRITLKLDGGAIADARFQARACSGTIAACSALCEWLVGMPLAQAKDLTADELEERLGGVPKSKRHSVEIAVMALNKALS